MTSSKSPKPPPQKKTRKNTPQPPKNKKIEPSTFDIACFYDAFSSKHWHSLLIVRNVLLLIFVILPRRRITMLFINTNF